MKVLSRRCTSVATFLFATLVLASTSCSRDSDEEQIRTVIDASEKAVESRSASATMKSIADDYRDAQGFDRNELQNFIRGYFLTHPKIELIVHVQEVRVETANSARARIEFAMVGTQLGRADKTFLAGESETLQVDFKRIDGVWRVARVDRIHP